ncbi:MAG: PIN domain-containing protein [Gammaproteobacteria bacterium]|nr:PIN domain-containing protein [Gammaproteobacteria bacterium]
MNLLLDTHVLLWVLINEPRLSAEARAAITDASNMVFVSAASVWEIAIKRALGKLHAPDDLNAQIIAHRFTPLSIEAEHAWYVSQLPPHHYDPFDRILIAQANCERCILVSRDKNIAAYDVRLLSA